MQELNAAKPIVQNPKVLETLSILFKLRLYQLNVALNMSACTTFVRAGRSAIEYTRVGEYSVDCHSMAVGMIKWKNVV